MKSAIVLAALCGLSVASIAQTTGGAANPSSTTTQQEAQRGVPGVDVDVNRSRNDRGVPGVDASIGADGDQRNVNTRNARTDGQTRAARADRN